MRAMERAPLSPVFYTFMQILIWVVLLPIMLLSQRNPDEGSIWRSFSLVMVGGMVLVAGIVIVMSAARQLADAGQPVFGMRPRDQLITDGWYGVVRNPQDVGTTIMTIGPAIALDTRMMWALPVISIVYYAIGIELLEDFYLFDRFDDEYEDYRRSVRKWLPRFRSR